MTPDRENVDRFRQMPAGEMSGLADVELAAMKDELARKWGGLHRKEKGALRRLVQDAEHGAPRRVR